MRLTGEEVFAASPWGRNCVISFTATGARGACHYRECTAGFMLLPHAPRNRVRRPALFFSPYSPDGTQDSAA